MQRRRTTYHFCCLKNRVVIHMNDAGNDNVWSTVKKSCHEKLARVFVYLNQNSLRSWKKHPHVLHWRLLFCEGGNMAQKLKHFLPTGDIGWLQAERRRVRTLKWILTDVSRDNKGLPHLMIGNVINRRRFFIRAWSNDCNKSRQCWLRWRVRTRCRTGFLWRRKVNNNIFKQALTLPLIESDSQVGGHLLFFLFLTNNRGHQSIHSYFYFVGWRWRA